MSRQVATPRIGVALIGAGMITLHFERGSLRVARHTLDENWRDGRSETQVYGQSDTGDDGPVVAKYEWHQAVIEDFVDAIRDARAPIVTGREALASHRLIEAIEISSRTGRLIEIED